MRICQTRARYILCLLLLLPWFSGHGQSKGYIVIGDTAYNEGFIKFHHKKPFTVEYQRARKASSTEIYSPASITEFGYRDSTKFVSREIIYYGEKRPVFLELIADGPLKLYKIRGEDGKQLYLENSELHHLTKENLNRLLQAHVTHSPVWERQLASARLSEHSLTYLVRNINKNRDARLPQFSFGPSVSLSLSTITLAANAFSENAFGEFNATSEHAEAGIFTEMPFWSVNNLSIISQVHYGKMQFVASKSKPELDQDFKLDLEYLRVSLLPRYYLNANRASLYLEAGADYKHVLEYSSELIQAKHQDRATTTHVYQHVFLMPSAGFSLSAGVGVQYLYLPRRHVSLSLSKGHTFGDRYSISHLSTTFRINI